jgi:hypothetical protein
VDSYVLKKKGTIFFQNNFHCSPNSSLISNGTHAKRQSCENLKISLYFSISTLGYGSTNVAWFKICQWVGRAMWCWLRDVRKQDTITLRVQTSTAACLHTVTDKIAN